MNKELLFSSGSMVYTGSCFSGIYGIQNHATSKWYVGESIHVPDRVNSYLYTIAKEQRLISASFSKYGRESFSCYALEQCDVDTLHQKETEWGVRLNSLAPNGYNLCLGGSGKSIESEQTKKRKSQAHSGIKREPFSETALQNMSAAQKGKKQSPEQIAKRVKANTGKTRTIEQRKLFSDVKVGVKHSEERRLINSKAQKAYNAIKRLCPLYRKKV